MKILLKASNVDLTAPLKAYVEEKFRGLEKFLKRFDPDGSLLLRVEVARATKHHKKGNIFYAEANLDIAHGTLRAESSHADVYLAINETKKIMEMEVKKHKEKDETKRR